MVSVNEYGVVGLAIAFVQPFANDGDYFLSQGNTAGLATFPGATDMRANASDSYLKEPTLNLPFILLEESTFEPPLSATRVAA